MRKKMLALIIGLGTLTPTVAPLAAREGLMVIASPALQPIAQALAKRLANKQAGQAVRVRALENGQAVQAFCQWPGVRASALLLTTRSLRRDERETCKALGVQDVEEGVIGYGGLVLVQSPQGLRMDLAPEQLYQALAAEVPVGGKLVPNPYRLWSDVNALLPPQPIMVVASTAVRKRLAEGVLRNVCREGMLPFWRATRVQLGNPKAFEQHVRDHCSALRKDRHLVAPGKGGAAALVTLVSGNTRLLGVMDLAAFRRARAPLAVVPVHGVLPAPEALEKGAYALGWAAHVHVMRAHRPRGAAISAFLRELLSDRAIGGNGYLARLGLAPLSPARRQRVREQLLQARQQEQFSGQQQQSGDRQPEDLRQPEELRQPYQDASSPRPPER